MALNLRSKPTAEFLGRKADPVGVTSANLKNEFLAGIGDAAWFANRKAQLVTNPSDYVAKYTALISTISDSAEGIWNDCYNDVVAEYIRGSATTGIKVGAYDADAVTTAGMFNVAVGHVNATLGTSPALQNQALPDTIVLQLVQKRATERLAEYMMAMEALFPDIHTVLERPFGYSLGNTVGGIQGLPRHRIGTGAKAKAPVIVHDDKAE